MSEFCSLVSEVFACARKFCFRSLLPQTKNVDVKFKENRMVEFPYINKLIFFTNCHLCIKNYEVSAKTGKTDVGNTKMHLSANVEVNWVEGSWDDRGQRFDTPRISQKRVQIRMQCKTKSEMNVTSECNMIIRFRAIWHQRNSSCWVRLRTELILKTLPHKCVVIWVASSFSLGCSWDFQNKSLIPMAVHKTNAHQETQAVSKICLNSYFLLGLFTIGHLWAWAARLKSTWSTFTHDD